MIDEQPSWTSSAAADIIRRFLDTLRKAQAMPPSAMQVYQRGLMERLVRHARAHVPFYRDSRRLDPLFRPDDSIDWSRWSDLVPVTRKDLQGEFDRLRSERLDPEHGRTWTLTTSGSTGEPVTMLHAELSGRLGWTAILLRDFERHGIDPRRRLAFLHPIVPGAQDLAAVQRREGWASDFVALGMAGERFDVADTRPPDELIAAVAALRPACLHVAATALELMLAHDRAHALARAGIEAILSYSEYLGPDVRRRAEQHVGCRVVDLYGSNECGFMASTCPHCGRLHLHAETAFVEIVNEQGGPCGPGETGQVLVTPFYNYAMPLIRYAQADEARIADRNDCVIRTPALAEVLGKKRTPFVFADGRTIRPTFPPEAAIEHLGARMFQVAQVAPDRCEFRIVPGALAPAAMNLDAMTALLRAMWWKDLQVDYVVVDHIPRRGPRGKIHLFVREMGERGAA